MSWTPEVTVTIDGRNLTGSTLETVRITRGREDVFAEPRASYCLAELIDLDGLGLGIRPLQLMQVTMKDSAGISRPVFTGTVSDTSAVLYDAGEVDNTPKAIVTVIATGPLARLNRRVVATGGRPEEKDGDRIAALIAEALGTTWEEAGGTWATTGTATTTWETFDPDLDLDRIDQPGIFDIAALDANEFGYSALSQSYLTSNSARGILVDTPDGFVEYTDGNSRAATIADVGFTDIPASNILAGVLNPVSTQSDVVNRVFVEFDGGTVVFTNSDSLVQNGLLAAQFETNLANSANAEAWALDYLEDHAIPVVKLTQVGFRLDGLGDTVRDQVITADVNDAINLSGLPRTLGVARNFPAFVEGVELRLNRITAEVILTISDAALSVGSQQWQQVTASITWNDVSATLRWEQAAEVTT